MKHLSASQVEEKLQAGEALNLIDVREEYEVAMGKIPTAVNIPLGSIDSRLNEFDKNKDYIVVCRSGNRSSVACQFLEANGYNVTNMDGGMLSWNGKTE